jgi:hypothetical protein
LSRLKAWLGRRQTGAAALAMYTLLALAMMGPLAPRALPVTGAYDICNHVSGIVEAKNALQEGQFPIRVPPRQSNNERFPLFQFYGNFPYTLGGALYLVTQIDPYTIWKSVVAASLICGGFFTYRSVRALTRQNLPALAAGVVFLTAPYMLTDIHGRAAFPEVVSFGLLPMVFYFAWRSFAARSWGAVLASGTSWCLLTLSHNITFLYGSLFIGLFFISYLRWQRRLVGRCLRVGIGYGLGLLLASWYLVPQQMIVPHFGPGLFHPVQNQAWLTPLAVLLAPSVALPDHLDSPSFGQPRHFGLQVGWLILVSVGAVLYGLRQPRWPRPGRPQAVRLLVLFTLALFLVWSPLDVWPWLPHVFGFVQFSYRLLMFVVLFGSLLAGCALAQVFQGRMQAAHVAAVVLAAGWSTAPYLPPHRGDKNLSVDKEIASPDIGRGGATTSYRPGADCLLATTHLHPDLDWVDPQTGGEVDKTGMIFDGNCWAAFATPVPGSALLLEGAIMPDAKTPMRLTIAVDDVVVAAPELPAGPFALTLPLPAAPGKDRVRVMVHGETSLRPMFWRTFVLTRFALQAGPCRQAAPKLVPACQLVNQMEWGHPTIVRLTVAERSLVQLPVAYYPYILDVRHNGRAVQAEHLGRLVALELPPGDHEIQVRVAGVAWANHVSLAAWMATAAGAAWLTIRSWRRRARSEGRGARPTLSHID